MSFDRMPVTNGIGHDRPQHPTQSGPMHTTTASTRQLCYNLELIMSPHLHFLVTSSPLLL